MAHPLAHILTAMAEGKKIQARAIRSDGATSWWFDIDEDGEIHPLVAQNLLMNNHPDAVKKHEFRIKP